MLKKKLKLPVQNFPQNSKTIFNGNFITVKVYKNNLGYNRVGVVIKKGVLKSAVKRNNIKRFIFNFFSLNIKNISKNNDILIIFKSKTKNQKEILLEELSKSIKELSKK